MNTLADVQSDPARAQDFYAPQPRAETPPTQPAEVLPQKAKAEPTKYWVYQTDNGGVSLQLLGDAAAANDMAALRQVVPSPSPDMKYVAIPARSVRLRGGESKQKTVTSFQ